MLGGATNRYPWRPAHVRTSVVSAEAESVTTHIFDDVDEYLIPTLFLCEGFLDLHIRPLDVRDEEAERFGSRAAFWARMNLDFVLKPARRPVLNGEPWITLTTRMAR